MSDVANTSANAVGILDADMEQLVGRHIGPALIIAKPTFNATENRWEALAAVEGCLCIVELRVSLDVAGAGARVV